MSQFVTYGDPDNLDRVDVFTCRAIWGRTLEELRAQCCCEGEEPLIFSHECDCILTSVWDETDLHRFGDSTQFAFVAAKRI